MKNTTILVTITGLPYAGKTTLRKAMTKQIDAAIISIDEINDAEGIPVDQAGWKKVHEKAYSLLKNYLQEGRHVIFDGGSLLKSDRERQTQIATQYGSKNLLIYVKTPLSVIKGRRANNLITKERKHVSDKLFTMALGMFEEPVAEENPLVYENS